MIKNLLEYQEKDKKGIELRMSIEGGRVKREINACERLVNDAKQQLLGLEEDAKNLTAAYQATAKNLQDLLDRTGKLTAQKTPETEDEIQSAAALVSAILQKVSTLEGQLENIGKSIAAKAKTFDDLKNSVVKAQTTIKSLTPQYETQMKGIKPQLDVIDKELSTVAGGIDKVLLEKYKARRKSDKSGKVVDIVVPVLGEKCGACYFEMPLSLIHKIATDGYILCEECGKILYKK